MHGKMLRNHSSGRENQVILSSLSYQILLYFGGWYSAFFTVVEVGLLIYKSITLPYPPNNMIAEVLLLLLLTPLEYTRIFLGKKGNLTERALSVTVSLGLTVPTAVAILYFLEWQTYVLLIERIICAIQMGFLGFQTLFGIFAIITFSRASQFG